jgi:2-dehydropantoate 2-reductase
VLDQNAAKDQGTFVIKLNSGEAGAGTLLVGRSNLIRKVAILGAGAMGTIFAAALAQGGMDVTLVDVWAEQIAEINKSGVTIEAHGSRTNVRVKATSDHRKVGKVDLILFLVKSTQTESAVRDCVPMMRKGSVVLSLQNGVGNEEKIAEFIGGENTMGGIISSPGGVVLSPGVTLQSGEIKLGIAEFEGGITERLREISEALAKTGIEVEVEADVRALKWSKLIVNLATNAMSAITGLPNAALVQIDEVREVMIGAVEEGLAVSKKMGIRLQEPKTVTEYVSSGTTHDPRHKSSMLVDIEMGRRSEIDYMNGVVVKYGKQYNVPTPINSTLVAAVKGLEYASAGKKKVPASAAVAKKGKSSRP